MLIEARVPQNLDFEVLKQRYPFDELPTGERSGDFLYWFCSLIVERRGEHSYKYQGEHYVALCCQFLSMIHKRYNLFMEYLFQSGVLIIDSRITHGVKCIGYGFTAEYKSQSCKTVEITDYNLRKAIIRFRNKVEEDLARRLHSCKAAYQSYLTGQLTIDSKAALTWIDVYYQRGLKEIDSLKLTSELFDKEHEDLKQSCRNMADFVERVDRKDISEKNFNVCYKGHRLHGMFTRTKKAMRHFTQYDGKPLVCIDIRNSQPYLSTLLLNPDFWRSKKIKTSRIQLNRIAPEIYKELREEGVVGKILKLVKSAETLAGYDIATKKYCNLSVNGQIYDHLELEMPKRLSPEFMERNGHRVANRDAIKRELLFIMYSRNYSVRELGFETKEVFGGMFPVVSKLFELIKGKGKDNRYKRFA